MFSVQRSVALGVTGREVSQEEGMTVALYTVPRTVEAHTLPPLNLCFLGTQSNLRCLVTGGSLL